MEIVAPIADEVAEENDAEVILSNIREAIE